MEDNMLKVLIAILCISLLTISLSACFPVVVEPDHDYYYEQEEREEVPPVILVPEREHREERERSHRTYVPEHGHSEEHHERD
jgi:hypothetical protein